MWYISVYAILITIFAIDFSIEVIIVPQLEHIMILTNNKEEAIYNDVFSCNNNWCNSVLWV